MKKVFNALCHLDAFLPKTREYMSLLLILSTDCGTNFILICGEGDKPCRMYKARKLLISCGVNGVKPPL